MPSRVRRPPQPNRIREARVKKGLTAKQLAEMIGSDRAQVVRWESGKQGMYLESAFALAKALGTTVTWLFPYTAPSVAADA